MIRTTTIIEVIDSLAQNPRPCGYKKLTGRNGYRIRVGTYRIIYDIFETNLIIEIVNLGVRGAVYED
jgi:mRNA interferase RelE/StbE